MNDKEIRKVLISYLKASTKEIRIYQEKKVGGSICDLMVVSECITGYEIKSDCDNYSRIENQVKNYEEFFDYNYVVVGRQHRDSISKHIPDSWGIVVIESDMVIVDRKPLFNKNRNITSQLSILWKLELKNLLNYFGLPMYAQKDRRFIINKLVESKSPNLLAERVAYELMYRDYSIYDAVDYTEYYAAEGDGVEPDILLELVDNVSEMNMTNMTLDQWIEIYRKAKSVQVKKEQKIEQTIYECKKHEISYKDIEVSPGAPWINKLYIEDFIWHLAGTTPKSKRWQNERNQEFQHRLFKVNYEPITGNWFINDKNEGNYYAEFTVKYGLQKYNALFILEALLNLREIKLYDKNKEYDEKSTLAANKKQSLILDEFKKWIWMDEDRKWDIEESYNNLFIKYKKTSFDRSELELQEMNPEYELFDYQKDAVKKIINSDNTLLAFDVGAGKTFVMIVAAMLMRKSGLSRKNMFVVPNNIVGQWEKAFTDLYPNARLFVIEPKSFKSPIREKVLHQMKYGDYDGIIIAYSCFDMIPISAQCIADNLQARLDEIEAAIKNIRYPYVTGSKAALEREKIQILKSVNELINEMEYDKGDITFDTLEINTLFLDEAHNYKNLPIRTHLKNIRGVNTKGSKKCLQMLHKVRSVQNQNNGRGVVFATGTPLCNSIADVYTMQMFLQSSEMETMHLDVFDNWVKTFARPERVAEIDVDAKKYRIVTRFASFFNLQELSLMFSQISIFHAMDNIEGIPECDGYADCIIKKNEALSDYMHELADRTERIRNGDVDRKIDNMLKVCIDGRKAALDLRLVNLEQPESTAKTESCVSNVWDIYEKNPKGSQLIFCDYSTPKKYGFNIYKEIKARLVAMGIPAEEIAFIHSYNTEERKVALYEKVNKGIVRVLIGSTFKLGIGSNVQTVLKAIHHLDVPWRPADMVQREGRILRRGNTYSRVNIYRYICEGSFDAYSWQILETKQRFISQFLAGSAYQRTAQDLEENVLNYAEVKALALDDHRMKKLAEKENELAELRIVSGKYIEAIEKTKSDITNIEKAIEILDKQKITLLSMFPKIKNKSEKDYKKLREEVSRFFESRHVVGESVCIGCAWDFEILVLRQVREKSRIQLVCDEAVFYLEMGASVVGNVQRISNFFKDMEKNIYVIEQKLLDKQDRLERMKKQADEANPYIQLIKDLEVEVNKLRSDISNDMQIQN